MQDSTQVRQVFAKYELEEESDQEKLVELILRLHAASVELADDATKLIWQLARLTTENFHSEEILALLHEVESPRLAAELGKLAASLAGRMPLDLLKEVVRTGDCEQGRLAAIYALGHSSFESAGPTLVAVACDVSESQTVRGQAVEALANLGDSKAVGVLVDLVGKVENQPPKVAFWLAYALGELRDKAAIPALQSLRLDQRLGEFEKSVADEAKESLEILRNMETDS